VLEDATGRAELQRLGARSIPVLSRGDKFVFAQNIAQVVEFLRLDENAAPVLSPAQLVERMQLFIDAALRIIPLMPDDRLDQEVPNRPRKWRPAERQPQGRDASDGASARYNRRVANPPARGWLTARQRCGLVGAQHRGGKEAYAMPETQPLKAFWQPG
jgi:hypothetical protein